MSSKRLHLVLVGLIVLLMLALVGGAYGTNKLLASESDKLVALKAKDQALTQEQLSLKKAKKDIQKYAELEKISRAIVPEDKNQAEAVREIVNIAAANGISLGAITFPASTLGTTPNGAPTAKAPAAAPTAPAAGSTKTLSQLAPVKNIAGIYELVITVNGDSNKPVEYNKFINFLADLEHNRRTAQVSSITLQPDSQNRNLLTFTLTLKGYIKP